MGADGACFFVLFFYSFSVWLLSQWGVRATSLSLFHNPHTLHTHTHTHTHTPLTGFICLRHTPLTHTHTHTHTYTHMHTHTMSRALLENCSPKRRQKIQLHYASSLYFIKFHKTHFVHTLKTPTQLFQLQLHN